jgi:hypothetical protein
VDARRGFRGRPTIFVGRGFARSGAVNASPLFRERCGSSGWHLEAGITLVFVGHTNEHFTPLRAMDAHGIMVSMVQVRLAGQKLVWSTVGAACAPSGLERYERLVVPTTELPELQGPILPT